MPLHGIDLMPALCGVLDVPAPEGVRWDGINIRPVLAGNADEPLGRRELCWQGDSTLPRIPSQRTVFLPDDAKP